MISIDVILDLANIFMNVWQL